MTRPRPWLAMAAVLAGACGGSSGSAIDAPRADAARADATPIDGTPIDAIDAQPIDAPVDAFVAPDAPPVIPTGAHHKYVINQLLTPTTNDQATMYGLDIGAARTDQPDGAVDNQLGHVLAALTGQGFILQPFVDAGVEEGAAILLADLQAPDFTTADAAGMQFLVGANPVPQPCGSAGPYTGSNAAVDCGKQFVGGSFGIAAGTPTDATLVGTIVGGTFRGGTHAVPLPLALNNATPVTLSLQNAKVKATGITDAAIGTVIIGGDVSMTDIDTKLIPALQVDFSQLVVRDCTALGTPPDCGCASGSTGATLINLFDGDLQGGVKDCAVSNDEISGNSLIRALLAPDVCIEATCTAPDGLSFGVQATATAATFTTPGQ